ncbi:MAG: hypothetical protein Q8L98_06370 [Chlamydiales bacterium]|nr:hypothetical protein [Chlamydiales bacterium]
MGRKGWMICSGLVWMMVGLWLLFKGIVLIAEGALGAHPETSLSFRYFASAQQGAALLIALGLLIGFVKGRFVLSKTVRRVCLRISELSLPIHIKHVYAPSYLLLLASMMLLGMLLRFIPIALDLKGAIDVAIGCALLNGSMLYWRAARSYA